MPLTHHLESFSNSGMNFLKSARHRFYDEGALQVYSAIGNLCRYISKAFHMAL
jgi:hypothetical protein